MSTPANLALEAIPRSRVYQAVAQQIQDRILTQLSPGDRLPSERDLAHLLGVSRSSVREAVHSLQLLGLLETRQGVGTVVLDPLLRCGVDPMADVLTQRRKMIGELLEVRRLLEPAVARIAARHISPEQLAEMENILLRQEEKLRVAEPAVEEDSLFHYAIAAAAHNSVLLKLVNVLMDLLREIRERSLQEQGRGEKSLSGHRRILEALKQHDAAAAGAAMQFHLSEIEDIVLNKLQKGWRLPHGSIIRN